MVTTVSFSNKHQRLICLNDCGSIVDPEVDGGDGGPLFDKASVLFGPNYPRLQQLKKQYDPEMLFSRWFPIRPAA